MKNAALASIAILKVSWDRFGRDYLDNLMPFVAEAIHLSPGPVISLPETQRRIQDAFGLSLGLNVLRTLMNRAAKIGVLSKNAGVLEKNPHYELSSKFEDTRREVLERYAVVVQELAAFSRQHHVAWALVFYARFLGNINAQMLTEGRYSGTVSEAVNQARLRARVLSLGIFVRDRSIGSTLERAISEGRFNTILDFVRGTWSGRRSLEEMLGKPALEFDSLWLK